ncbi:MAG: hypothetical protein CW342_06175 [Thermoactinomycetaceae bacterium]|nr:hypothetical protein [Thermoactinomycetaceae bacterium]
MTALSARRFVDYFQPEQLKRLSSLMTPKRVQSGTNLFQDKEQADYLYFIHEGIVKIFNNTESGEEIALSLKYAGDMVGDPCTLSPPFQWSNAVTLTDALLGVIRKEELEALMLRHPDLALRFIQWLSVNQRILETKVRDLLVYGKTGALASTLIRLCNTCGRETEEGILIPTRLTNQDLANFIGATRESVNRMLSRMKRENILSMRSGSLIIHDLNRLREFCHCDGRCPGNVCVL